MDNNNKNKKVSPKVMILPGILAIIFIIFIFYIANKMSIALGG